MEDAALGDREHKTALFDQFARVGKARASSKRLELLDLLAQGERDVASLAAAAARGAYCVLAHDAVRLLRAHGRDATRL